MEIILPQPKVLPGQKVWVKNYRKKYGDEELATVCGCKLRLSRKGQTTEYILRWAYDIVLVRRTPSQKSYSGREYGDRPMFLYVGDDGVRIAE